MYKAGKHLFCCIQQIELFPIRGVKTTWKTRKTLLIFASPFQVDNEAEYKGTELNRIEIEFYKTISFETISLGFADIL
jgi:hypothetical protein